jgi:hypothetical protein
VVVPQHHKALHLALVVRAAVLRVHRQETAEQPELQTQAVAVEVEVIHLVFLAVQVVLVL